MVFWQKYIGRTEPKPQTQVLEAPTVNPWILKAEAPVDLARFEFTAKLEDAPDLEPALKALRTKAVTVARKKGGGIDSIMAEFDTKDVSRDMRSFGFTSRTISGCYNEFSSWVGATNGAKVTTTQEKEMDHTGKPITPGLAETDMGLIAQTVAGKSAYL